MSRSRYIRRVRAIDHQRAIRRRWQAIFRAVVDELTCEMAIAGEGTGEPVGIMNVPLTWTQGGPVDPADLT